MCQTRLVSVAHVNVRWVTSLTTHRLYYNTLSILKINGKGRPALILANTLPTLVLVVGVLFFAFGGMYIFFK